MGSLRRQLGFSGVSVSTLRRPRAWMLIPIAAAIHGLPAYGEETGTATAFMLGQVDVEATSLQSKVSDGTSGIAITAQDMADQGALTVGQALDNVPGVIPTFTGKRNESQVEIRGFSAQQITLNIDGIPIYVPYDGNVDLSRLLVPGVSEIVVTRGLGSLMYGPNNMGGSINIVTQAPTKKFEGSISTGLSGNTDRLDSSNFSAQLGSRIDSRWYIQGGVAAYNQDTFPLSGSFTPVAAQPSGNRLNASSHDVNGNLKIGFTPNATDEYALGIYTVRSNKGSPPYTGTAQKVSYWTWPQWDKTSEYFIGKTAVGSGYLKTRVYHDGFTNRLDSYDNANYNTTTKPYSFLSKYDDYSNGASAELGQPLGSANFLKAVLFYKEDVHREVSFPTTYSPVTGPWLHFKTQTESAGLEDTYHLSERTKITAGYRYDRHEFNQAERYLNSNGTGVADWPLSSPQNANNVQIVATHDVAGMELRAGIGRKTRLPGIKDMYSSKLGSAVPNPNLGAEQALNREVGVSGKFKWGGDYDLSLYWDTIDNAIESVSVAAQAPYCSQNCTQNQNVGGATNKGLDLTVHMPVGNRMLLTLNYSYLVADLAEAGLVATDAPRHRGNVTVAWYATGTTQVLGDLQASSGRESATSGAQPVGGDAGANLRLIHNIGAHWTVNAGIYNLFDRNYAISEGYPMPGRTLHAQATYKF